MALLIAAADDWAQAIVARLADEGLMATQIGRVVRAEQGCLLRDADDRLRPLPTFSRDEVTRVFEVP